MTVDYKLDMTMMQAIHDALRRDAEVVAATVTARTDGWDRFQRFLHLHHGAEDDALWPVLRARLVGRHDDLALIDEMESEHAAFASLLDVIDVSWHRRASAPLARADLAVRLDDHLAHEETMALPVIDRTLSEEEWMQFGVASTAAIGPDMPAFLPWVLDGADAALTNVVLGRLPEPAQQTYRNEWQPAYAAKNWWAT